MRYRGRHIDQPGAFDLNSFPERLAVGNKNAVHGDASPPFRGRWRFALDDFDRRLACMFGKAWAGGKKAGVPPIEDQIGGFIAVRAMKDFVPTEDAFYDGFAGSWVSEDSPSLRVIKFSNESFRRHRRCPPA